MLRALVVLLAIAVGALLCENGEIVCGPKPEKKPAKEDAKEKGM